MDIEQACKTIRQAFDFSERGSPLTPTMEPHDALQALKQFIEVQEGLAVEALIVRAGLRELLPYITAVGAQLNR